VVMEVTGSVELTLSVECASFASQIGYSAVRYSDGVSKIERTKMSAYFCLCSHPWPIHSGGIIFRFLKSKIQ
jgi:hypothetical protein